jgi:hypothetical protein
MDASHFDTLTRILAQSSRRQALRLLGGLALVGVLDPRQTEAKRKKKRKKKHRASPPPTSPASPPVAGGCPSGQKPCDGGCIPSNQCCNNADCTISGQVCGADRQCACSAAYPEICGGACVAPCSDSQERNPESPTCRCCTKNGFPEGSGNSLNCCSRRTINDLCAGLSPGEICRFSEQCERELCFNGSCASCSPRLNYCTNFSMTCAGGSPCLLDVEGTPRCGIPEDNPAMGDCGWCTSNFDCDQGQRPGAFCAVDYGDGCGCPTGQTFCARPA